MEAKDLPRIWQVPGRPRIEALSTAYSVSEASARREIFSAQSETAVFDGNYLKLKCANHLIPFSRAVEIARAHTQEQTPLSLEDVYLLPEETNRDQQRSDVFVIKKSILKPFLAHRADNENRIRKLLIQTGPERHWLSTRALESLHPAFRHIRQWRNFLAAAFFALIAISCATYAHTYVQYSMTEQALSEIVDAKRVEALKVRKLLDQQQKAVAAVESARKGKSQAVPVVRVWEELTRILPEDAWLTDFAIDGSTLTITGFAAQSAASLIATLDASPLFSDTTFTSPVVRIPGQSGERFEIRLKVRPT